jgi:xanthine dehydrogenase molybdenum-binding subunit
MYRAYFPDPRQYPLDIHTAVLNEVLMGQSSRDIIGRSVSRVDSPEKVTGDATYLHDIHEERTLHAKIKRSPHAHASVTAVDATAAREMAGVRSVITPWDVPETKNGVRDSPADQSILNERMRFQGDAVAAVAAVDEETAADAVTAIDVEYDQLPAVFDAEDAMEADAPQLHDYAEGNVATESHLDHGDVDAGFAAADHVVESRFQTSRQIHVTPETYGCVADYRNGELDLLAGVDKPYYFRNEVAQLLEMSPGDIRLHLPEALAGGFGKENYLIPSLEPLAAVLSKDARQPVSLALERGENFVGTVTRHPVTFEMKTGVDADGEIVARQCRAVSNTGAYLQMGEYVIEAIKTRFHDLYPCDNLAFDGYTVYTNTPIAGAARGIGSTQIHYAMESHMDEVAEEIELDPVELRRRNHIRNGETQLSGSVLEKGGLRECIDRGAEEANWPQGVTGSSEDGVMRGRGMACVTHISGVGFDKGSTVNVKLDTDGKVTVLTSNPDSGHGSDAMVAQVAAGAIGADPDRVDVSTPDTAVTPPEAWGSSASRSSYIVSRAAYDAAIDAREKLFERAARHLEVPARELELDGDTVHVTGDPDAGVTIEELMITGPEGSSTFEDPPPRSTFGTCYAEVAVDTATGMVSVERITHAQDVGFALNPKGCEGQIEGGVEFAMEFFLDELAIDEGQPVNNTMIDFKALVATEMPDDIQSVLVEPRKDEGVQGAKGLGTGIMGAIAPAIANAIYDATGVRIRDLPFRPEMLLDDIEEGA